MAKKKSTEPKSFHSLCMWTFHAGKGGFVPANIRPYWKNLSTEDKITLIGKEIKPRIPDNIQLGVEMHYDNEVNERDAVLIADAIKGQHFYLAMVTPGAHGHFGYGGIASMDPAEREDAGEFGKRTVDLAYGPLKGAWSPEEKNFPTLVLWNGSWGYDIASPAVKEMLQHLDQGVGDLISYERYKGGELPIGVEPKANEGHPRMLLPTVGDTIAFIHRLRSRYNLAPSMLGVNMELGHTEMIGLDTNHDIASQVIEGAPPHVHVNSQGGSDGITQGGTMFDLDHEFKITGFNIANLTMLDGAGYNRWFGHDFQPREYDNEEQALDRVVRGILSLEASKKVARKFPLEQHNRLLVERETAKASDLVWDAVITARREFERMYKG